VGEGLGVHGRTQDVPTFVHGCKEETPSTVKP